MWNHCLKTDENIKYYTLHPILRDIVSLSMKFKKERHTFETYRLKQAIDICVATNHLIKDNMKRLKSIFFYNI